MRWRWRHKNKFQRACTLHNRRRRGGFANSRIYTVLDRSEIVWLNKVSPLTHRKRFSTFLSHEKASRDPWLLDRKTAKLKVIARSSSRTLIRRTLCWGKSYWSRRVPRSSRGDWCNLTVRCKSIPGRCRLHQAISLIFPLLSDCIITRHHYFRCRTTYTTAKVGVDALSQRYLTG